MRIRDIFPASHRLLITIFPFCKCALIHEQHNNSSSSKQPESNHAISMTVETLFQRIFFLFSSISPTFFSLYRSCLATMLNFLVLLLLLVDFFFLHFLTRVHSQLIVKHINETRCNCCR